MQYMIASYLRDIHGQEAYEAFLTALRNGSETIPYALREGIKVTLDRVLSYDCWNNRSDDYKTIARLNKSITIK